MPSLRLLPAPAHADSHGDEVLACVYAPDSKFVLSGGWDGCLRTWDTETGKGLDKVAVSPKPVSACAVSPDASELLAGTLEGMLSRWNAVSRTQKSTFLAHTRPISAITYASDGRTLATASYDRTLILGGGTRESRTLSGHTDAVGGCCFTPNAQALLSWSHDNTTRLWDVGSGRTMATFKDFHDRVLCGAISPDNRWIALGGRDHALKILDLIAHKAVRSVKMPGPVRCCHFLLDGQTLVAGDETGHFGLYSVPDLKEEGTLETQLKLQCGALAPSGAQIAVGADDGRIHLLAVDGFDAEPLLITVRQQTRRTASTLQRFFGRSSEVGVIVGNCPVCRAVFEYPGTVVETLNCPGCRRPLRITYVFPRSDA